MDGREPSRTFTTEAINGSEQPKSQSPRTDPNRRPLPCRCDVGDAIAQVVSPIPTAATRDAGGNAVASSPARSPDRRDSRRAPVHRPGVRLEHLEKSRQLLLRGAANPHLPLRQSEHKLTGSEISARRASALPNRPHPNGSVFFSRSICSAVIPTPPSSDSRSEPRAGDYRPRASSQALTNHNRAGTRLRPTVAPREPIAVDSLLSLAVRQEPACRALQGSDQSRVACSGAEAGAGDSLDRSGCVGQAPVCDASSANRCASPRMRYVQVM